MNVALIKYNAGNIHSMMSALERLGISANLTDKESEIRTADKVIFPGVGEASTAMRYLNEKNLQHVIKDLKQPFLGVCLGLQLMCKHSEENNTRCLGVFDIAVKKFEPKLKVPHMGWNTIEPNDSPLFKGLSDSSYLYFVHSYYAEVSEHTIASCDYVNKFSAAINKDNYYAVQAHPEKSGEAGGKILENFLAL